MNYVEFGKENQKVIVLLHGGGLSWWNYKEVAKKLANSYHVVLPILNGHAGSDLDFTTIEQNSNNIVEFISEKFGGSVLLMGGLSLGGQILLEVLSSKSDICKFAIIESALVLPSKFTHAMIKPAFGGCYGLIKRRWFSKLQFWSLKIKKDLFEDYYKDTCAISKSNMIAFLQENSLYSLKPELSQNSAKAYVFVGKKENATMKKSAKLIVENLKNSQLFVLEKLHHGEFSINNADKYVSFVEQLINND